jgi:hypothetical protein
MNQEKYEQIKIAAYNDELEKIAFNPINFARRAIRGGARFIDEAQKGARGVNRLLGQVRGSTRHIRNIRRDVLETAGRGGALGGFTGAAAGGARSWVKPAAIGAGGLGLGYMASQSSRGGY